MPGPLFSFAAVVGAAAPHPHGLAGAALALVALFLPGLLLVAGTLPFWEGLRRLPLAPAALAGANAAVVGVLALALWDPVWTESVHSLADALLAGAGFVALARRVPPVAVVLALVLLSVLAPSLVPLLWGLLSA
jgi:chromate transporter